MQTLKSYFYILAGSIVMALGVVGFLAPNHVATGGTAGLAIVLHEILDWPIGIWMALINIPLVLLGLKILGRDFFIKTLFCIITLSVSVDVLRIYIQVPALSNQLMLATLYGGILVGAGLGFIFKGGASAGGGTIIAKIVSQQGKVKTSTVVLLLDAFVVSAAAFVFKSVELGLWSLISIYVTTKLIDMFLIGVPTEKIVHISSVKNLNELSQIIFEKMGISGTIVKGHDLRNEEFKDIIFLMVDKSRLQTLKQIVKEYDQQVKMIVMEAAEVMV
jgi:uncharacterized membrane-anchored protein YitT (DUF2179 family)